MMSEVEKILSAQIGTLVIENTKLRVAVTSANAALEKLRKEFDEYREKSKSADPA